ncbi:MAG TPA: RNase adapter RapZ [Allosphingosinicella sp.]|nr:RNase adapter RapZ [Allosphingosinicella sp.]
MTQITILSFAFSQGEPPPANLSFDMRFLRNPHWQEGLRALTGRDASVGDYIAGDAAFESAIAGIEGALLALLPLYSVAGNAPVSVAFGCTGGRHRSVYVAEHVAGRLRAAGFSPTIEHRDLATPPRDVSTEAGAGRQEADEAFQGD